MMKQLLACFLFMGFTCISCKEIPTKHNKAIEETYKAPSADPLIVYQTENLVIKKLSNHVYQHKSYLQTEDFGKVGCNGMLVVNDAKAVIFDTTTDTKSSQELINFITKELKSDIQAIVPTHFHADCVGGIEAFQTHNSLVYANKQTVDLLKEKGENLPEATISFEDRLTLSLGDKELHLAYFGAGHTKDNIIAYFPEDKAMFGGCLIKKVGAGKGNLEDANVEAWSDTVRNIKEAFPEVKIVLPGHGKSGGTELLDYTIHLFEEN